MIMHHNYGSNTIGPANKLREYLYILLVDLIWDLCEFARHSFHFIVHTCPSTADDVFHFICPYT